MKRKTYNENFFEIINDEDKAYFLGLIYSDGSIINNEKIKRYQLVIKLHIKDQHILNDFIKCINGEMELWKHGQREIVEVKLSGKKLINDLKNYGLHPNKTFTLEYPNIDEKLERHFLRGYFDGDGCIRLSKDKRDGSERGDLRIVGGSINMLDTINKKMNILFGTNLNKLYGPKDKNFKYIGWASMDDIEKIYKGFYDDSNFYLSRKKTIFDNVMEIIKNKQKYRKQ